MGLIRWALTALLASASPVLASECLTGTAEQRQFHSNETAAFIGLHQDGRVYFLLTQNPETKAWAIWTTDPDNPPGADLELGKLCLVAGGMDSTFLDMSE